MKNKISPSKLKEELNEKSFILLGEIHGTKEIPLIIKDIILSLLKTRKINLFLEVPLVQQKYLYKDNIPFYEYRENSDGRNSKEYLDLIKLFRDKVNLFFIDPDTIINRDYGMYSNILKFVDKNDGIMIFIAGNAHTSTKPFKWGGEKIYPAGYFLKKKFKDMAVVQFIPLAGEFFNITLKKIDSNKKIKKNIIIKNGNNYNYYLKNVSPCSFVNP